MTLSDWALTMAGVLLGALVGSVLTMLCIWLYQGMWILVILFLPMLLVQVLFEGAVYWVVSLLRRSKDTPEAVAVADRAPVPKLRQYSFQVGAVIGVAYALYQHAIV